MTHRISQIATFRSFCVLAVVVVGGCQPSNLPRSKTDSRSNTTQDHQAMSLMGQPLHEAPPGAARTRHEAALARARAELLDDPEDPLRWIWVGRQLGYLWRMPEAIETFTLGIERFPDDARFYRHRGHRYISARQFDLAIADLEQAARMIEGRPDRVEPDGLPNALNIPLTTTGFNVWYHLGLARYLSGDYAGAVEAYRRTLEYTGERDDNLAATSDWLYMSLQRLGRTAEANAVLDPIHADMNIIENHAYHRRLMLYKGLLQPEAVWGDTEPSPLDLATLGYGLGNWYQSHGHAGLAYSLWERVTKTPYWPAFGYIAAEVDLARLEDDLKAGRITLEELQDDLHVSAPEPRGKTD